MLNNLYQKTIIDLNRQPHNFGKLEGFTHSAEQYNPTCGDDLTVYLKISAGIIDDISFDGDGCAISRASASLMTDALKGKKINEASDIYKKFYSLLDSTSAVQQDDPNLKNLTIFSDIKKFPSRITCAKLPWEAFIHASQNRQ
ncbi:MAG: SUF system NifU family Fe-S cluster assembly protein [Candidatus Omnitrophica bacterium]|nr:SUF system NifU family Fe-S cluster assembly protein [Candidatus Omnitrophota bacterium]